MTTHPVITHIPQLAKRRPTPPRRWRERHGQRAPLWLLQGKGAREMRTSFPPNKTPTRRTEATLVLDTNHERLETLRDMHSLARTPAALPRQHSSSRNHYPGALRQLQAKKAGFSEKAGKRKRNHRGARHSVRDRCQHSERRRSRMGRHVSNFPFFRDLRGAAHSRTAIHKSGDCHVAAASSLMTGRLLRMCLRICLSTHQSIDGRVTLLCTTKH